MAFQLLEKLLQCIVWGSTWYNRSSKQNVLFLTSENETSGIICSLFRARQTISFAIFSTKFVVKCATKILKIGWQIQKLVPKIFLNREFSIEKQQVREVIIFPENLKNVNILL